MTPDSSSARMPHRPARRLGNAPFITFLAFLALSVSIAVGPAWAQGVEVCDGIDNNNNGQIDEGYDVDGDGVARCCWDRHFFAGTTNGSQQIDVHYNFCSAAGFNQGLTPAYDDPQSAVQLQAVGEFDKNPGLDIIWRDVGANWGQQNITTCMKGEWQTFPIGGSDLSYFGGANMDLDDDLDLIGLHADCCPVNAYAGVTDWNSNAGWPAFSDLYGTWDPSPLQGEWGRAWAYNLEDFTNDNIPDLLFWNYANGGSSTTDLNIYRGNGAGSFFQMAPQITAVNNQPQNFGDMGDINGDGCTDWVGGPDDDGNKGKVYARLGDCSGGVHTPPGSFSTLVGLVDTCPGTSCPGTGVPGMGMSQLFDWDCDGDLDLLTSRRLSPGATGDVLFWENLGGGSFSSTPVTAAPSNPSMSIRIASPLRK